ncbi:X-linked retinitis pigmentosa GTPase regulator-like isoform X2 [Salminus brasiliensis]|uniref:X-linked retinitis pigmentosa GTPase regulator-like isoform X2 n=1 Tax=Salminus brasiliensis TaxID=930266 RepID=UPI003B834790
MAGEAEDEIPESGAVFTFGKSKFADNAPSKFWLKNDVPLKVACGDEHTALITESGKLFMFGSSNWGQLGLGTKTSVNKPTCVKALKSEKVKLVACGRTHTLVYTSRGNLYVAGGNDEGQLGLGDYEERTSFQLVDFFTKHGPIKMLAAGSNTSAALMQDGRLYVWGDNSEGQIGLGKEAGAVSPRELSVGRRVAWVSCGYYHSAFVTVDGALFTFGERDSGKLGLSTAQLPNHKVPQHVEGISDRVLQVACGGGHTVALTEDYLYSFGLGQFGQLGHGTFIFESRLPRVVEHFRKGRVKYIACGENHTAVLTDSGLLYTFGDGRHGKLGLGEENFTNQFKPTLCPRFLKYSVQSVTCGGCHMLVLAKPRLKGSEDVILEDDDITEDYFEKTYTELLGETATQTNLNRSLSARVRRRERERSPEQFGIMFRTLPPLSSGYLSASLPVSSQTLPPRLHSKMAPNGFQKNGLHPSTGKVMEEHEVDGKRAGVETSVDNESVKDLGETTDFLNVTHVMKMDPGEKTLTLSPIQKDYRHRTIELSDDETNGEEDQTEDEEEEEEEDEVEEEEEEEEHNEESKKHPNEENGKELLGQVEEQEIKSTQPIPQEKQETSVPDGPIKDGGEKDTSTSLIEERPLSQSEAKQEKSKSLFGSNSKLSLFKRRSSTKDKKGKEKAEALVESTTSTKPSSETPSVSSDSGEPEKSSSVEDPSPQPLRSRSATCSLL